MFGLFDSIDKTHEKLHIACSGLSMVFCYYEIMRTEFDRLNMPKDQRIKILDVDPEEGAHYALLSMKIIAKAKNAINTIADAYIDDLTNFFFEDFKARYVNEDQDAISDMIWHFPGMNSAWVKKLKEISPQEAQELMNKAVVAINNHDAAKAILKAFQSPRGFNVPSYKNRRSDVEVIHQCFDTWATNGWYEKSTEEDQQSNEQPPQGNYPEKTIRPTVDTSYFDNLKANADVSETLYEMIVNINQAMAHFTAISTFGKAPEDMKEAFKMPLTLLHSLHSMFSSIVGFSDISTEQREAFFIKYLFDVASGSLEELKHSISKYHSWYLDRVRHFNAEKSMEFDVKAGKDNNKMVELLLEYFSTPEQIYENSDTEILKADDNGMGLKMFQYAILSYLEKADVPICEADVKRGLIKLEPTFEVVDTVSKKEEVIQEEIDETPPTPPQDSSSNENDGEGAGFL